jgi:methyl-accepting chemotaxis protein
LKNLTLKAKLWTGFGSLLIALLFTGSIGVWEASTIQNLAKTVQFNVHKRNLSAAIALAVEREKVGARDVLLHDGVNKLTSPRAEYQNDLASLEPLLSSPTSRQLFAQLRQAGNTYDTLVDQSIRLRHAGDQQGAVQFFYGPELQASMINLKKIAADLMDWYAGLADQAQAEQIAATRRATTLISAFAIVGLLVGLATSLLMVRYLLKTLSPIVASLDEIAKSNFCIPDIEIATQDELGRAALAVNNLKATLGGVVRSITRSSEQLAAATEEIAMTARQSSASTLSQADQALQVASAMQQMAATVREVAGNAQKASEASLQSAHVARQGGQLAQEALSTMHHIAASTNHAAERILELGKSSEQIGNIVEVITEIAGQTNLLALNAAIEAARAGEQGRGFAVVAGEVRRLAERTTTATQEIAGMIQTIQSETRTAVEAIQKGSGEVALGVDKTSASGQALSEIIRMSDNVGQMISQIATAASQQNSATEQVSLSISQISTLTQSSSVNAEQTAASCANLSSLASNLQRLINDFCVNP